jgi:hypothetical protein
MKVLAADDHFVRNSLIAEALRRHLADPAVELTELPLPWPLEPFSKVAEVDEASDTEDALLSRSRVVTLHTRLTPETQVLIRAPELALMPRGSVLVNAARGTRRTAGHRGALRRPEQRPVGGCRTRRVRAGAAARRVPPVHHPEPGAHSAAGRREPLAHRLT